MATRKSPEQAVEIFSSAERDLSFQRKLKVAENEAKLAKSRLAASEAEVGSLLERIDLMSGLAEKSQARTWKTQKRVKNGKATAILAFSDWHIEQCVKSSRVSGLNDYNLDVADKRIKNVFNRSLLLLEDARNLVGISDIVVWLGGDFIHGFLHDENPADNHLHPFEACRWACDRIESGLRHLIANAGTRKIVVVTSVGNHGRNSRKMPASALVETSYEHNMYLELRRRFSNEIEWQIGEGYFNYLDVYDYPIRFHHGDRIKFGGGVNGVGVPAYRFISNANTKRRAYADVFGHFHCFGWPGCLVSNGSLVGVDEYSQAMTGDIEPKQAFIVVDKDRGITRALPIFAR